MVINELLNWELIKNDFPFKDPIFVNQQEDNENKDDKEEEENNVIV